MRRSDLWLAASLAMISALGGFGLGAQPAGAADAGTADDAWPQIVANTFANRTLQDGAGLLRIEMPARAEDAAVVPVTIRTTLPPGDARRFKSLTLVIDENPAPVAATFTLGAGAGVSSISTRVRVNTYTHVHLVGETSDGALYVVQTYVKASGGCAAPALKDAEEAKAHLGEMRLRQFARSGSPDAGAPREAQIMIRHPNNSGLQMDQVTHLYIPAFFVQHLTVWQGDAPVLAMDGGISIAEDPNIRFTYVSNGAQTFRAQAQDTENHVFSAQWPADASQM